MTSSSLESATYVLVAKCLKKLLHWYSVVSKLRPKYLGCKRGRYATVIGKCFHDLLRDQTSLHCLCDLHSKDRETYTQLHEIKIFPHVPINIRYSAFTLGGISCNNGCWDGVQKRKITKTRLTGAIPPAYWLGSLMKGKLFICFISQRMGSRAFKSWIFHWWISQQV
jgi:hypothetical protein